MSIVEAVLLGALQGLTEFLPVSSSGHLVLARTIMKIEAVPILFDIILHLATLFVVIWTFRVRIGDIIAAIWRFLLRKKRAQDRRQLILTVRLLEASIITAVLGLAISGLGIRGNPASVAALFIVTAFILLATLCAKRMTELDGMGRFRALVIGGAQGLGVFPGISRSGITISVGLLLGLNRKAAGEFSFLLSIPAIFGALLLNLKDAGELSSIVPLSALIAGFFTALFVGYLSLRFLLWLVADGKLWVFAIYLIPVGTWALVRFM